MVADIESNAGEAEMIWTVIALLVLVVFLLTYIAFSIDWWLEWISRFATSAHQTNAQHYAELAARLEEIERHTARMARPFYEGDEQKRQRERDDPYF